MIPVILSGGSGTRLWPVSRELWPKQFAEIFENSLLSMTISRLKVFGGPLVLTSVGLKSLTQRSLALEGIPAENGIYEPIPRNTAPAVAFLIQILGRRGFDEQVVGLFPADHLIENQSKFEEVVSLGIQQAQRGRVVTLGIEPDGPKTGFGYIELKNKVSGAASDVLKFHEKPSLALAEQFFTSGRFVWNAGIYLFKISTMRDLFKKHQPDLWNRVQELKPDNSNLSDVYQSLASISLDVAIAEKLTSQELSCIPCEMGWSDVGSWDAVSEIAERSRKSRESRIVEVSGEGNFVVSPPQKVVGVVGLSDLIVVDTKDALLICKKGETQSVKTVVEKLAEQTHPVLKQHLFEKRPWGEFEVLHESKGSKTKIIRLQVGHQLSLQSHRHHDEHWVVTQGEGEVVLGEKLQPVRVGSYLYIPKESKHRIRNTGSSPLEFVEVQLGTYLSDEDIVRYADDYNRI